MRVVEDEPYLATASRDGLRLEAIAAAVAGDSDEIAQRISASAFRGAERG